MPADAVPRDAALMFFLFFGYGTKVKALGTTDKRTCPRCHNTCAWQRLEQYRYLSLFFVPLLRFKRQQLEACPVCGHAELAEAGARPRRHDRLHPVGV